MGRRVSFQTPCWTSVSQPTARHSQRGRPDGPVRSDQTTEAADRPARSGYPAAGMAIPTRMRRLVSATTACACLVAVACTHRDQDATDASLTTSAEHEGDLEGTARPEGNAPREAPVPSASRGFEVVALDGETIDADRNRRIPYRVYAPAGPAGPIPVVLVSHGGSGSERGYRSGGHLGKTLAAGGYIAVHVGHLRSARGDRQLDDRPADVSHLLDQLDEGALVLPRGSLEPSTRRGSDTPGTPSAPTPPTHSVAPPSSALTRTTASTPSHRSRRKGRTSSEPSTTVRASPPGPPSPSPRTTWSAARRPTRTSPARSTEGVGASSPSRVIPSVVTSSSR